MENPLTYALKNSQTTQSDLARKLGISRQYISRVELGLVNQIKGNLGIWVTQQLQASNPNYNNLRLDNVQDIYHSWQREKRFNSLSRLLHKDAGSMRFIGVREDVSYPPVANFSVPEEQREAFIKWRKAHWPTTYAFSKAFCIHPASVDLYENGTTERFPNELEMLFKWFRLMIVTEEVMDCD